MRATESPEGQPPPGRRPRRPPADAATRRARKDVVLNQGAMRIIDEECRRRGSRISETLSAIVNEWELLRGVRQASAFRHDMREDLNAIRFKAQEAAAAHGRERDEALRAVDARTAAAVNRLVLVTVL